jgi:hypothetical protein
MKLYYRQITKFILEAKSDKFRLYTRTWHGQQNVRHNCGLKINYKSWEYVAKFKRLEKM